MRKCITLLVCIFCASVCWGQTIYYSDELPVDSTSCTHTPLSATLYAHWLGATYYAPYTYTFRWPPTGSASNTVNAGSCVTNDHIFYNRHSNNQCTSWWELWPDNPLNVTINCGTPGNTGCYVYSVSAPIWLRLPGNDY